MTVEQQEFYDRLRLLNDSFPLSVSVSPSSPPRLLTASPNVSHQQHPQPLIQPQLHRVAAMARASGIPLTQPPPPPLPQLDLPSPFPSEDGLVKAVPMRTSSNEGVSRRSSSNLSLSVSSTPSPLMGRSDRKLSAGSRSTMRPDSRRFSVSMLWSAVSEQDTEVEDELTFCTFKVLLSLFFLF
jgi:hypothetical protein